MKSATFTTDTGRNFRLLEIVDALKYIIEIKPNTKYRLYAEEVPECPRYFIDPEESGIYWYALAPSETLMCYDARTGDHERTHCPLSEVENEGLREVTREQAKAHISEPEKCVWREVNMVHGRRYESGCQNGPRVGSALFRDFNTCPYCGRKVELQDAEPTIPPGYRVPKSWEIQIAKPPNEAMFRYKNDPEWHTMKGTWGGHHIIVPASWTPLPKCRDCGEPTTIVEGDGEGYNVECAVTKGCTMGPVKSIKSEAVKAYPKGE